MKMKTVFVASLAAMTLAACSKDADSGVPAPAAKTNFAVSLPGGLETYAVEKPQAAGQITPYYDNVTVYLVDAGNNAVGYAWTDAEIKARKKAFGQINEPAGVFVIVNAGNVTLPTGSVSFRAVEEAFAAVALADQNQAAKTISAIDDKGNFPGTYNPVQQVTLVGEQTVFTMDGVVNGYTQKTAAVELESLVARFELGTVKAGTGLDALTVEAVYLNNVLLDFLDGPGSVLQFVEGTWPATFTPEWATDTYSAEVTSNAGTKVYAYQFFAGDGILPHVIYKVSGTVSAGYKLSDGTGDENNPTPFTGRYITVKGFRENGTWVNNFLPNKIYKMGLENGGIEITPDKITDKPEKNKVDLTVAITVADWTAGNVTPEI